MRVLFKVGDLVYNESKKLFCKVKHDEGGNLIKLDYEKLGFIQEEPRVNFRHATDSELVLYKQKEHYFHQAADIRGWLEAIIRTSEGDDEVRTWQLTHLARRGLKESPFRYSPSE